jgi:predicted transcriptional regulator
LKNAVTLSTRPEAWSISDEETDLPDHPVLENARCRRIYEELGKRPGLNQRRLCDHLDLMVGQVQRSLDKLKDADLVVRLPSERDREVLAFRKEDEELWENERLRVLYGRQSTRRIALHLAENPGAGSMDVAEAVGLSKPTVLHHIRILRDHELVAHLKSGRSHEYHPSNELKKWARTVGRYFDRPHETG